SCASTLGNHPGATSLQDNATSERKPASDLTTAPNPSRCSPFRPVRWSRGATRGMLPRAAPPTNALLGDRGVSGSFLLRPDDRNSLLRHHRGSPVPAARLRCLILLLLDAGHPWSLIAVVLKVLSQTAPEPTPGQTDATTRYTLIETDRSSDPGAYTCRERARHPGIPVAGAGRRGGRQVRRAGRRVRTGGRPGRLTHWKNDPDLASVRAPAWCAARPPADRGAWEALGGEA